jgi:hypothetical protein
MAGWATWRLHWPDVRWPIWFRNFGDAADPVFCKINNPDGS